MNFEETKKAMAKYCTNEASYSYLKDKITDYIEQTNTKNQTQKIEMICSDLFEARYMLEQGNTYWAVAKYNFVKNYLLNLTK